MLDLKELRKEFKEKLGANSRTISVRNPHYSSIVITIKDLTIDKEKVIEIAKKYESVDRCHVTGEVLAGGNTFVSVSYDDDILELEASRYIELAKHLLTKEENFIFRGFRITESKVHYKGRSAFHHGNAYALAKRIAIFLKNDNDRQVI